MDVLSRDFKSMASGRRCRATAAGVLVASLSLISPAFSQTAATDYFHQIAELIGTDGAFEFGGAVAISGDGNTLVVGASTTTVGDHSRQGAAFVFIRQNKSWTLAGELTAADGQAADFFGGSVAISYDGATVIVGATDADQFDGAPGGGAAYVFVRPDAGWTSSGQYAAKLTNSDGVELDYLGSAVALSGDGSIAVVGATKNRSGVLDPKGKPLPPSPGSAYLYVKPLAADGGWGTLNHLFETAELTSSDGATDDAFGASVAIANDGSRVIVGAPEHNARRGEVYLFLEPNDPLRGWAANTRPQETNRLIAADAESGDEFGTSVATDLDAAAVAAGAPGKFFRKGAAYLFSSTFHEWAPGSVVTETARLSAPDGGSCDSFGSAVAIEADGRTVLVGAPDEHAQLLGDPGRCDLAILGPGGVYIFKEPDAGWSLAGVPVAANLRASDAKTFNRFGASISISAGTNKLLAGSPTAPFDTPAGGVPPGTAYVFDYSPPAPIGLTAVPGFIRTFNWGVQKAVDRSLVKQIGGTGTFNYTIYALKLGSVDSDYSVEGQITISNPGDEDVVMKVTAAVDNNGSCVVFTSFFGNVTIAAGGAALLPYLCSYGSGPSATSGTVTATAVSPGLPESQGSIGFTFAVPAITVNQNVTVTDQFNGGAAVTLGIASQPSLIAFETFTESRSLSLPTFGCMTYPNIASIKQTGQTATASVTTCGPAYTGARSGDFWASAAGEALIATAGVTTGACDVTTWLRQFAPFQDMRPRGACLLATAYVTNTMRAAGRSLNASLKAEVLATALNVYFSDPSLGGNRLAAPVPIGAALVDLTDICASPDANGCEGYEDVRGAFGGAVSLSVLQMVAYAASQSNVSGSVWYGNLVAIETLATDAFHAINGQVAFAP
jgi:FG-GAP repeat